MSQKAQQLQQALQELHAEPAAAGGQLASLEDLLAAKMQDMQSARCGMRCCTPGWGGGRWSRCGMRCCTPG